MTASPSLDELQHEYGSKATAVEPGGDEPIPVDDRHGRPSQMFWTWVSPNMEFATIFVGIIAVLFFGLTFWQAVAAIVIGNALGAVAHGLLTSWGPERGLAQNGAQPPPVRLPRQPAACGDQRGRGGRRVVRG